MAYSDIPVQCRGTINIGGTEYHYRLDQYGQVMIVKGKDPRDWTAIDAGALDYTRIASQEHQQPGFQAHDGPKIRAACHLCNGANPGEDIITAKTRALIAAKQAGQVENEQTADDLTPLAPVVANSPAPETPDAITAAEQAKRAAEAKAAELQAQIDQLQKQALPKPAVPERPTEAHDSLPEGKGRDPWNGQVVDITRNDGADAAAPYGRKADGSPRRPSGRKPGDD